MPQELQLVYEVETGMPAYMHSVDANEAVMLGDYVRTPPHGMEVDSRLVAAAKAKAKGMNAEIHPELLTPEERQRRREDANRQVMPVVTIPTETPVMVQAGDAPDPAAMRQQAQRTEQSRAREALAHQEEQRQEAHRQEAAAHAAEAQRDRQQQARQAQPPSQPEKK